MIKIGIVGCGRITQNRYADVFESELKETKVVIACDKDREKANKIAKVLNCQASYDINDVINSNDVDLVLVATESGNHYEHSLIALKNNKHVVTEKPPTLFPDQAEELKKLADNKGLMYAPIFQNRYNPSMKILKKTFNDGRFGKVVLGTIRLRWCRYQEYYEDGWHGTWEMDGGVINQQAIHHVDALQWICGPIESVCSAQTNALNNLEAEDTTVAVLKFKNGSLGVIEATTAARPDDFEASISIVGEKGMASIGGIALNKIDTWKFVDSIPEDGTIRESYSQDVPTGYGLSHGPLMQDIIVRLNDGIIEPPISVDSIIQTLKLVHAIYKSTEVEGWVDLNNDCISERLGEKY